MRPMRTHRVPVLILLMIFLQRRNFDFTISRELPFTVPQHLFNIRDTLVDVLECVTHHAKLLRERHAEHFCRRKRDVCPVCR